MKEPIQKATTDTKQGERIEALRLVYSLFYPELYESAQYYTQSEDQADRVVLYALMRSYATIGLAEQIMEVRSSLYNYVKEYADCGCPEESNAQRTTYQKIYNCFMGNEASVYPEYCLSYNDSARVVFFWKFFCNTDAGIKIRALKMSEQEIERHYHIAETSLCYLLQNLKTHQDCN